MKTLLWLALCATLVACSSPLPSGTGGNGGEGGCPSFYANDPEGKSAAPVYADGETLAVRFVPFSGKCSVILDYVVDSFCDAPERVGIDAWSESGDVPTRAPTTMDVLIDPEDTAPRDGGVTVRVGAAVSFDEGLPFVGVRLAPGTCLARTTPPCEDNAYQFNGVWHEVDAGIAVHLDCN